MQTILRSSCCAVVPGLLLLAACQREVAPRPGPRPVQGRPTVLVDNYPLLYFTQRLAGAAADVGFPAPRGVDPAFWKPDESAIRRYQAADLILLNGASYAQWTERVSLPQARIVDTSRAFAQQYITIEEGVVHRHGLGGEHAHEGVAFTTWLDPRQAVQQAQAIRDALAGLLPAQAGQLELRFQELKTDLDKLDARLSETLQGQSRSRLLASHPVYQYLARRCQWDLPSVHWEPEELPSDAQWQAFAELLVKHPAQGMLWEAPPRQELKDKLQQLGVACVVFYPCSNVPDAGDYLQVMQQNIDRLAAFVPKRTE